MSQVSVAPIYQGDEVGLGGQSVIPLITTNDGGTTKITRDQPRNGAWAYSLFHVDAPNITGVINWIEVHIVAASNGGYASTRMKTHGSIRDDARTLNNGAYVDYASTRWTSNPVVGGAWTIHDLAELQIGFGAANPGPDAGTAVFITQSSLLIDFTPDGSGVPQLIALPPTSNASVQLTPSAGINYQCIDEATPDDGDYVRNGSAGAGQIDLYGIDSVLAPVSEILYVVLRGKSTAWNNTYGNQIFAFEFRTHGQIYASLSITVPNTDQTVAWCLGYNPYTGSAWTLEEINDLQYGVYLYSPSTNALLRCTWVRAYAANQLRSKARMAQMIGPTW